MGYSDKTFSHCLGDKRIEAHLSQEGLAARSGIAFDMIVQYESGRATPDLETAYVLALALDCGIDDLVGLPRPDERKHFDL